MRDADPMAPIPLTGFNHLTKSLGLNLYDVRYAASAEQGERYLSHIDETYGAARLADVLREVSGMIGAKVLNVSCADYEPHGASAALLIAEGEAPTEPMRDHGRPGADRPQAISRATSQVTSQVFHLDKSHITIHTYPEEFPRRGVCAFRVDIDVSTCGRVSPLQALPFLISSFGSDIVIIDYRVRGFTRNHAGGKRFMDHDITSIQDYIPANVLERYQSSDMNMDDGKTFHTKMRRKERALDDCLFGAASKDLSAEERRQAEQLLRDEIHEIYAGHVPDARQGDRSDDRPRALL